MLANEDVLILKFWFYLPKKEQEERLKRIEKKHAARHVLADWAALKHHKKASEAGEKIILETSKGYAPWFVIPSQDPEYRDAALAQTVANAMKLKLEDGEPHSIAAPPVVGGLKRETAVDTIDLTEKLEKVGIRRASRQVPEATVRSVGHEVPVQDGCCSGVSGQ